MFWVYTVFLTVASFLVGGACMLLYIKESTKTDVLFFPDPKLPCNSFYNHLQGGPRSICHNPRCQYAHDRKHEFTSLMEIFKCLNKATKSVDLCVFDFTHTYLADFLIYLDNVRRIQVRIITDAHRDRRQENNNAEGDQRSKGRNDQIPKLQSKGIKIRVNSSDANQRALMHNKFVLIDNKTLLMGSFNWTFNAALYNHEAVIRTSESRIVRKFVRKFNEIWQTTEDRERELPVIRVR